MKSYVDADSFLEDADDWKDEMTKLRQIMINQDVDEEIKWGKPCYNIPDGNIAIIQPFKNYCALMFFKGVLLKDPEDVLIQMTENTQAARQLRFTNIEEIEEQEAIIKEYVKEAIKIEKSGKEVKFKKTRDYPVPEEFQVKLDAMPELKEAFENLTPGRQRGYLYYFNDAKKSETRTSRVEKYIDKILDGKGMRDK